MAQQTITVNTTASLTANGNKTATGSISWTAPSLPDGVSSWDSVVISGMWTWNGKGSISIVTINGTNTTNGVSFSVLLDTNVSSPLSITCIGNKNATGSNFSWNNLIVTYKYTEPTITQYTNLRIKQNGEWIPVKVVYKKENGVWIEQTDLSNLFDTNIKYINKQN